MSEQVDVYELDEDDFDALEELLISDVVPDDCMNLEMLDGYLAAVVSSPIPVPKAAWLPPIWTAHADEVSFASGHRMQRVIRLVLGYYNELATTVGLPDGWQPFCYAGQDSDEIGIGEEWVEGFQQGLELWPEDWREQVGEPAAVQVDARLEEWLAPWREGGEVGAGDDRRRLAWIAHAADILLAIVAIWSGLNLARPLPLEIEETSASASRNLGRNAPCACGSGQKYKKCCGAN